jgi:hypothetical protein
VFAVRRIVVVVLTAFAVVAMGLLAPGVAGAAEHHGAQHATAAAAAAPEAAAASSPKCGPTASWGKIRYQACVRFNCDATSCLALDYLGVVNKATSARTVTWDLGYETGRVTLRAGEQRTIESTYGTRRTACGITLINELRVKYDSAGWSPNTYVSAYAPCR